MKRSLRKVRNSNNSNNSNIEGIKGFFFLKRIEAFHYPRIAVIAVLSIPRRAYGTGDLKNVKKDGREP